MGSRGVARLRSARRVDAGCDLQRFVAAKTRRAGERGVVLRQQPRQGGRPMVPVRRDLGEARTTAERRNPIRDTILTSTAQTGSNQYSRTVSREQGGYGTW